MHGNQAPGGACQEEWEGKNKSLVSGFKFLGNEGTPKKNYLTSKQDYVNIVIRINDC